MKSILVRSIAPKLFILVIIVLFSQCRTTAPLTNDLNLSIQQYLDSTQISYEVPGISIAFIDEDGVAIKVTAGMSDKEENVRMAPGHVLMSGSIGKTYVATVAFKLIQEGKLSLQDSLIDYIGDYTYFDKIPNAPLLTIEHLMTHTSGVTRYILNQDIWEIISKDPLRNWSPEDRLSFILGDEPLHAPGEGWAYSDTNYILLGMVIEKLTGKKYNDLVKELILIPLKLKETFVNDRPEIPQLSAAYSGLSQVFKVKPKVSSLGTYSFNPDVEWTGGGISSTTADLARWIYKLHHDEILNANSYETMITPLPFEKQLPDGAKYGHGCMIWNLDGETYLGHSGIMPGFLSIVQYNVEDKYALAVQINTDLLPRGKSIDDIARNLHDIYTTHKKK